MNALFVTWDGPGPNYLESLYLPIFSRLHRQGVGRISVLQYYWDAQARSASIADAAAAMGMSYWARDVGRGPHNLVTGAMMMAGGIDIARYVRINRIDVLMPRSIVPAAMCLAALRFLPGVKLLYDADGLMADERADFGGWRHSGLLYRLFRRVEQAAVARADAIVTRTCQSRQILAQRSGDENAAMAKTSVTSNGRDSHVFLPGSADCRAQTRDLLGVPRQAPLVVYAGSLGAQYFPERMVAFFQRLQRERNDARFLILTGKRDAAYSLIEQAGVFGNRCIVRCVHPEEVPALVASADLGLAFRVQCLSQQAVAPIKVGEYLLCGLPVFCSAGVGDLDSQIGPSVGRLAPELSDQALDDAVRWFVDVVLPEREVYRQRCRQSGLDHFSLQQTVEQFRAAFDHL